MIWHYITGVGAGVILSISALMYIIMILMGKAQPQLWTWCVFFVGAAGGVIAAAQSGAGVSGLIGPVTLAFLLGVVFVLSWSKKYRHKGLDRWWYPYASIFAVVVYAIQIGFHVSPVIAAAAAIFVDLSALCMQAEKSWKKPHSEEMLPWLLGTVGGVLTLLSLHELTVASSAFFFYFTVTNAALVAILWWRTPRVPVPTDQ